MRWHVYHTESKLALNYTKETRYIFFWGGVEGTQTHAFTIFLNTYNT